MNLAPVLLFAYKRPWHLKQTVEALQRNILADQSELFIFSDGQKTVAEAKKIAEVRKYIYSIRGFARINIFTQKINQGLANSIITGVTKIIKKYGKVIVLEDDLLSSPNYLKFMNSALNYYEKDKRIFSVTGYNYPIKIPNSYHEQVYLAYRCTSWGWATWRNRWQKVDWMIRDYKEFIKSDCAKREFIKGGEDLTALLEYQMRGFIDSWAIRFCYAHYKNNAFCLHPTVSKIKNIGLEGSGTHKVIREVKIVLDKGNTEIIFPKSININCDILKNFSVYFKKSLKTKIINFVKNCAFQTLKSIS